MILTSLLFQEGHEKYFLGHPLNFGILKKVLLLKKQKIFYVWDDMREFQGWTEIPPHKDRVNIESSVHF